MLDVSRDCLGETATELSAFGVDVCGAAGSTDGQSGVELTACFDGASEASFDGVAIHANEKLSHY